MRQTKASHIAILKQPFFDMILDGEKTIESRWSMDRRAPYNRVKVGDAILLKETGKDVTAAAEVKKVEYFELTPEKVESLRAKYGRQIGVDKFQNWSDYLKKKYCTLIWLENVRKIEPIHVPNSHGAGWITLNN